MKRRSFLSLIGAASAAPLIPNVAGATAPSAAAGYTRYMYGLAVFQARTRATVSAADLIAKLRITPAMAEAMIGEMSANGVLAPALSGATGTLRAVSPPRRIAGGIGRRCADAVRQYATDDGRTLSAGPSPAVSERQAPVHATPSASSETRPSSSPHIHSVGESEET